MIYNRQAMRILITLLIAAFCFATANAQKKKGKFSAYLCSVEVGNKLENKVDSLQSIFADGFIGISWTYTPSQMEFILKNQSNSTIRIIWDETAFIGLNKISEKIYHKGVKLVEKSNSQQPTPVYKDSYLSELVAPSYCTVYDAENVKWRYKSFITGEYTNKREKYNADLIGKIFKIVLPIKVEDRIIEYTFYFKTKFVEEQAENHYQ